MVSSSPVTGAINVPINASIDALFNNSIAPASVNSSSFTLSGPSGLVAGDLVISGSRITFQPSGNLQLSTSYTATITTAVTKLAGYGMSNNFSWTFTTGLVSGSPEIPSFSVTRVTASQVDLIWSNPSAGVSVTGYRVYRDGVLQQSPYSYERSITDWGLNFNSNYCYTVSATIAGNELAQVGPLCVTTKDFLPGNIAHWGGRGLTNGASNYWSVSDPYGLKKASFPDVLMGIDNVSMVSLSTNGGLALKSNGTVWGFWGSQSFLTPTLENLNWEGLNNVIAVAAGARHSLHLKADGTVWAWGSNDVGQLGNGSYTGDRSQVVGMTAVVAAAAGDFSLALKSNGTVWSWGLNDVGQLGDGTGVNQTVPVQVVGLTNAIAVAASSTHSLAVKADGTVWAWGNNYFGQLGDGTVINQTSPVQVAGLTNAIAVAAAMLHSLALRADGTVWAWGNNYSGQLGDGTGINQTLPVQVVGLTDVIAVAAGGYHSLALKSDGSVWAWGLNYSGQLGDGTNVNRFEPVKVLGVIQPKAIFAGLGYSMALK